MFHAVELKPLEQQCHRFLWRDMNTEKEPDVFVMVKVNMGDRPAPAIATEALNMTAEMFQESNLWQQLLYKIQAMWMTS